MSFYKDLIINRIEWHRGIFPEISGYFSINPSELNDEFKKDEIIKDFMEKYDFNFDEMLNLIYYDRYDYYGNIISNSMVRFSVHYIEFLCPGCPGYYGINTYVEYPELADFDDIKTYLKSIIEEDEYEKIGDDKLKYVVERVHEIVCSMIHNNTVLIKEIIEELMEEKDNNETG
ncbi:MAG: hypothetical protein QXD03_05060 [Candidatus Anstonellales archaeon]